MIRRILLVALPLALAAGCGDDPASPDRCMVTELPLSGSAQAPSVTDVALELQPGEGVIVVATATDPQGSDDLRDVIQSVGVFPDDRCEGAPIVIQDDLVGSGIEETFGTAVEQSADPALYDAIDAAVRWPVEVDFRDAGGNRTTGRVLARLIR